MPLANSPLENVSLDDKYTRHEGRIHITGTQALVRAAMLQHMRDRQANLNTACYISGYRGSPMHNVDKELWRIKRLQEDWQIHFWPAVNEDLAATAIWGTQQANAFGDANYDGVFSMWYGKGPGLDRSLDAIRHGHMAGSSKHGGVLVVVGDDHALTSTDTPAAHEHTFVELMMPLLYPADVQDIIDYSLYGWALSRYCGAWVGFKIIPDTVDASSALDADPERPNIILPTNFEWPNDGLNLRIPDTWLQQEPRLRQYKLSAAIAFAQANQLNRVTIQSKKPRYGIIASGKAYNDIRQALLELGIDDSTAADIGITLLKLAMPYPFDGETMRQFADSLEEVLVVEEKHRMTEMHLRDALYNLPDARRPRVIGRVDESGQELMPAWPELTPEHISRALVKRISHFHDTETMRTRMRFLDTKDQQKAGQQTLSVVRTPYFCSGCPHNSSTRVPEGSRALGGVGCHFMATTMDRNNITHTHMGGEGINWVGQAPFVSTPHVFQNIGDGTYYHSGLLAIRAAVAAKVNITYKILFNDAVAMTGGQPVDGPLNPMMISQQVHAEGVQRIYVVSDEPEKYTREHQFAPGAVIEHRKALDRVQRECRDHQGVSVLIYDQTCAAEKRRRRKRGKMIDPPRRMFINDRICEGCGDCNSKSNCMSVLPLDTEYGRKRQIDQSACNKDYSCAEGFCPSFVSVYGAEPRKNAASVQPPAHLVALPEPDRPQLQQGRTYSVLVTGVGGTGVVTIGALLTMAAHMEGKYFSTVDQFGMAQKGGAVTSHIRLANREDDIRSVRLNAGSADLILGCDSLVTGADLALSTMALGRTRVIINTHEQITGHFTRNPDMQFPALQLRERISNAAGQEQVDFINATRIATRLLGDSIASNLFMLGYAYQKGLIPVSATAIEKAIELNAVAIEMNKQAFVWGRRAVRDWKAVSELSASEPGTTVLEQTLDELIESRSKDLTQYQSAAYAKRYRKLVEQVRVSETEKMPGHSELSEAVARYFYKLMAYKDEYEVARLYTDGRFEKLLNERFEGEYELKFHLAPPLFARKDKETGLPAKQAYGAWVLKAMKILASLRKLRGTPLDIFGRTAERRQERQFIADYETVLPELLSNLSPGNHALAVNIASIPEKIRGYGHVKERHIEEAKAEQEQLLSAFRNPVSVLKGAA